MLNVLIINFLFASVVLCSFFPAFFWFSCLLLQFVFCLFLFIYLLWLFGSWLLTRLSLVAVSRDYPLVAGHRLHIAVLFLLQSTGSGAHGLQQCTPSVVMVHGPAAPLHVESSQTRDRTHVPYIGRQTPNHWTTREVLWFSFIALLFYNSYPFVCYDNPEFTVYIFFFFFFALKNLVNHWHNIHLRVYRI